jgi:hypothetical protein
MATFGKIWSGAQRIGSNPGYCGKPPELTKQQFILPARRRWQDAGGQRSSQLAHRLLHRPMITPGQPQESGVGGGLKSHTSNVWPRLPFHAVTSALPVGTVAKRSE